MKIYIRKASMADLNDISRIESECFPEAEAATRENFKQRLIYYPDHFWLLFAEEELVAFVDGFVTDEQNLNDEMYENASMHDQNGKWQMIFGVNTIPACRKKGYAGMLLEKAIEDARNEGRKGVVLTCKERLISFYEKFGFEDEGISSDSIHGGVVWHQMRCTF